MSGTALKMVAAVLAVATLTSCGRSSSDGRHVDPEQVALINSWLQKTEADHGAQDQIGILKEARDRGEVTFDMYERAFQNAAACWRSAGLGVVDSGTHAWDGLPRRQYGISQPPGMPEDKGNKMTDLCRDQHFLAVEMLYQTQPSSLAVIEDHFGTYRKPIITCLRQNGAKLRDDSSRMEVLNAAEDLGKEGHRCVLEAGYVGAGYTE